MGRIGSEISGDAAGWTAYGAVFLFAMTLTVDAASSLEVKHIAWPLGIIASWRYGWQAIHFSRAELYKRRRFPEWRAKADAIAADPALAPGHVGVVVTSYQISARENYEVYAQVFVELIAYGAPATVVASVTDDGDARLIHQIFREHHPPGHIRLITQLQAGTGKRDAMVKALRVIQRLVEAEDGVVILMDGDTVVTPELFARTFPFFRLMSDLGALTVNNDAEVRGGGLAKTWYAMRFALRTLYMSSLSVSRKVLCLTGRFSVFRAEVALTDAFIERLGHDSLNHWRLGKVPMLTGDDKSTWFHCLKNRWAMIYVPDAYVRCLEELPSGGFMSASAQLMKRWFGNMLRNSDRSIALGPRRIGFFTWWCLVDQRLSMWTSLSGPLFVMFFLVDGRLAAVPAYIAVVFATRFIQTLNVAYQGGTASVAVPFLLLHQQFVGSALKINALFHLDQQKWTRQNITSAGGRNASAHASYGDAFKIVSIIMFISLALLLARLTSA